MPNSPYLLLDVDGVLNPFGYGSLSASQIDVSFDDGSWVRYDPETPARLARLGEAMELVWATAWGHSATTWLAPVFGLSPLPVVEFEYDFEPGESWKLEGISEFVGARPFAWVDDDIGEDAHGWANARGIPTLMLDIPSTRGLGEDHVERLLEFAAGLRAGSRG